MGRQGAVVVDSQPCDLGVPVYWRSKSPRHHDSAAPGRGHPSAVRGRRRVLELHDRPRGGKEPPPPPRSRCHPRIEHHRVHPALLDQRGRLDRRHHRPPQPVEPGDPRPVAPPGDPQRPIQTGPASRDSRGTVGDALLAAGRAEHIGPRGRMPIAGEDPGRADPHPSSVRRTPRHHSRGHGTGTPAKRETSASRECLANHPSVRRRRPARGRPVRAGRAAADGGHDGPPRCPRVTTTEARRRGCRFHPWGDWARGRCVPTIGRTGTMFNQSKERAMARVGLRAEPQRVHPPSGGTVDKDDDR